MDADRNAPATKGDLQDLKEELLTTTRRELHEVRDELRGELHEVKDELRREIHEVKDELLEAFRDGQTELLKAFYSFAQSADAKFKDAESSDTGLRLRLSAVELRLTEIERKLNLPPAA